MTKILQPNPEKGGTRTVEAPAPPSKGKIYAIDQHPDVNVASVVTGTTPHNMKVEKTQGNMTLEELVSWLKKEASGDDLVLVEAGLDALN